MLTVKGLCKRYGNTEVVRNLDLNVRRGNVSACSVPTGPAKPLPCACCWDRPAGQRQHRTGAALPFRSMRAKRA